MAHRRMIGAAAAVVAALAAFALPSRGPALGVAGDATVVAGHIGMQEAQRSSAQCALLTVTAAPGWFARSVSGGAIEQIAGPDGRYLLALGEASQSAIPSSVDVFGHATGRRLEKGRLRVVVQRLNPRVAIGALEGESRFRESASLALSRSDLHASESTMFQSRPRHATAQVGLDVGGNLYLVGVEKAAAVMTMRDIAVANRALRGVAPAC